MIPEKIANFEKVSKSIDNASYYDSIILPKRATTGSAGYDFYLPIDIAINPNESKKIMTGVRVKIDPGYVLMIFPRSSLGTKYHLTLDNTVGIIDSDYYKAINEGHIIIVMTNHSNETLYLKKYDRFAQGIFLPFGITKDDVVKEERIGGFGSTDNK